MSGRLIFGESPLDTGFFYDSELGQSASKLVAERRAYARFSAKSPCLGGGVVESDSVITQPYEKILTGPRLVPPPSLTSVDFTHIGTTMADAFMFDATVNFTCYSPEQFNGFDGAFFRLGNEAELVIGYVGGNQLTTFGKIKDFSFTVNEKLHYDCSVTFTGAAGEVAAAFGLTNKEENTYEYEKTDKNGVKTKVKPQSIVGIFRATAQRAFQTPPPVNNADGDNTIGYGVATWGIGKIQSAWFFGTFQEQKTIYYVALRQVVAYINQQLPKSRGFQGISIRSYDADNGGSKVARGVKSSNPLLVLNQLNALMSVYGPVDMNFSGYDFYIAIDELEKIEKDIKDDDSDNPHPIKSSIVQFIKRVLDTVNLYLGHCIKLEMIMYGQGGDTSLYGYEILNTKTLVDKSKATTEVNPLTVNSKIRSLNIQSQIDSKMAAIAHTAAQSGEGHKLVKMITGCPITPPDVSNDVSALNANFATFNEIDYAILADCVELQIKICNVNNPQTKSYNYGITVEIEVDGYPSHAYGKVFKMSGVPKLLADNYFVVLKQGHKFQDGDWTTTLEGHMYVDAPAS